MSGSETRLFWNPFISTVNIAYIRILYPHNHLPSTECLPYGYRIIASYPAPSAATFRQDVTDTVLRCKTIALTYKKIYNNRYSSALLSDHAARKSGNARRKPETGFSDAISKALGRLAAQSSESEKYSEHSNLLALYIVVLPHENTPVGISTPGV